MVIQKSHPSVVMGRRKAAFIFPTVSQIYTWPDWFFLFSPFINASTKKIPFALPDIRGFPYFTITTFSFYKQGLWS